MTRRTGLPRAGGAQVAGRWSLLREAVAEAATREENVERLARQLLARYGVVVRKLLERESLVPPWRELLRVLRRLEMRGEIRGGRFLQGAAGEQFALPEAVELLRATRRRSQDGARIVVSGGDPLNLTGILLPGERLPALSSNRVVYQDGVPVAAKHGGELRHLREPGSPDESHEIDSLLVRGRSQVPAHGPGRPLPLLPGP